MGYCRFDQSIPFDKIILNLDQWIRCCVKSSIFSSGGPFVQQSRTGWAVLSEGLIRNFSVIFLKFGRVVHISMKVV